MLAARFPADAWNVYPFHFSDGDNWPSDNDLCHRLSKQLVERSNLVGFGEIRQGRYSYQSTLMHALAQTGSPKFLSVTIADKSDVYPALRLFFGPREATA